MSNGKNSKGQFEKGYQPFNKGLTGVNGDNTGRPPHFKTPEELEIKWEEYKSLCKKKDKWLEQSGFISFLNVYRDLLTEYKAKPLFSDILGVISDDCKRHLLERGLKNEYNSAIVKLIASHAYNMSEKTIHSGDADNPIQIISNIKSKREE